MGSIEVQEVFISPVDREHMRGHSIGFPKPGVQESTGELEIKGWALSSSSPIVAIEVTDGRRVLQRTSTFVSRPDVLQHYTSITGDDKCGFQMVIDTKDLARNFLVQIRAVLEDGRTVSIGTIKGNMLPDGTNQHENIRAIVAGPPKTGNVWIKNILSVIYNLEILTEIPDLEIKSLERFILDGRFKDNSIFHQHFAPEGVFFDICSNNSIDIVTTIRNPYDTFVSLYFFIQNFGDSFVKAGDVGAMIIGKPINHTDVLNFLRDGFKLNLIAAKKWTDAHRSVLVRYEDLHSNPFSEVKKITEKIRPVDDSIITHAIEVCKANSLKKKDADMQKHIRSATIGDWRNHLTEEHLNIIRNHHAELIRSTGYEVL